MKRFESRFVIFSRIVKSGYRVSVGDPVPEERRYYWKLLAPNNEVVARGGEPFNRLASIKRSISRVRKYAVLGKIRVQEPK